jgi:hypothetical protein
MHTSINEAVQILKQKAREDAALFYREFGVEIDPSATDWDSITFKKTYGNLAFETKDVLENCSDFRDWIPPSEALERSEFSDCGWEIYQSELVAETHKLAQEK